MSKKKHVNRLSAESSPYLLQHASNPVDWYPWSEEALEMARKLDRPVLLSIGYAACHWCHVMEEESFVDPAIASVMNESFINIKVDREERPDIDMIYMDAVQLMTGQGGWPLHCFLTPDLKPFYGGTYFPPVPCYNRPSWLQVLEAIAKSWRDNRSQLTEHGVRVMEKVVSNESDLLTHAAVETDESSADSYADSLSQLLDNDNGGLAGAPKFPCFPVLNACMHFGTFTKQTNLRSHAHFTLETMLKGGIYDVIDGGICRYAVDEQWTVPHFEKMLYDNAALLHTLALAHRQQPSPEWEWAAQCTTEFLESRLANGAGGYFSAMDADSEGSEGKFYAWQKEELIDCAPDSEHLINSIFHWPQQPFFEGKYLLIRKSSWADTATEMGISASALMKHWKLLRSAIREVRDQRTLPFIDRKEITSWNAQLIKGLAASGAAMQKSEWLEQAHRIFRYINNKLRVEGSLVRFRLGNHTGHMAFLEDHAWLLDAALELAFAEADFSLYSRAGELLEEIETLFERDKNGLFYFNRKDDPSRIINKYTVFDLPYASPNALIAMAYLKLGCVMGRSSLTEEGFRMLNAVKPAMMKYPGSMTAWSLVDLALEKGLAELAIIGPDCRQGVERIRPHFSGEGVLLASMAPDSRSPLLNVLPQSGQTYLYRCKNYVCNQPVSMADYPDHMLNTLLIE